MKSLCISHLFPNNIRNTQGLFVFERVRHQAAWVETTVFAPVPWFPGNRYFSRYAGIAGIEPLEIRQGLTVHHPRFLSLPGLHFLSACFLALALLVNIPFRTLLRKADWLDAHWTFPDGFATALLGLLFHKPFFITLRGHEAFYERQGFLRAAGIRWSLRRATGVIAVSEELRLKAIRLSGVPLEKIRTVGNGVDLLRFHPLDKLASRSRLGLSAKPKYVLTVGRICSGKGLHHLVKAWPKLLLDVPDAELLIVGEEDPEGGQAYLHSIKASLSELGLHSKFHFIGKVLPDDLTYWYSAADCFCLPTASEGSPNVLLEALACGRPAVATAVGDISKIVVDGKFGYSVDSKVLDFAAKLSQTLRQTWEDTAIAASMQAQSWERCAEQAHMFMTEKAKA